MSERVNAIDAARGLCLVNIFVNHVSLGVLSQASPSKIAFCDSADIFVLLAGISAFLAYGPRAGAGFDVRSAQSRTWRRALTLYLANLAIMAASALIILVGAAGAGSPTPGIAPPAMFAEPGGIRHLWDAASMQQSVGYSMVLRLYVFLMLAAPLYLWLASKRFWYPLVPAAALWLIGGHFGLVARNSLTGELFSMTILPWQLVFAGGISLGAAIAEGARAPRAPALVWASAAIVASGTLLLAVGDRVSPDVHGWLATRNDFFWTGISKTYQSPLRLLYLAALVHLVVALPRAPLIRLLHSASPAGLLCRLGRRSLHVFAVGAVFALALDQLLWNLIVAGFAAQGSPLAILVELALAAAGLWLMVWVAGRRAIAGKAAPGRLDTSSAPAAA